MPCPIQCVEGVVKPPSMYILEQAVQKEQFQDPVHGSIGDPLDIEYFTQVQCHLLYLLKSVEFHTLKLIEC